jgi:uncharacterized metal-binding protein
MLGDFPDYRGLYSTGEKRDMAYHSALVEAGGYCHWTRVREIAEFAHRMGYARLGVGHCSDMKREASLAARYLEDRSLAAVLPSEQLFEDPSGQAEFFADNNTQFNIIAGMCVGHDAIFIRSSQVPVTSLVVRDRRLRHNPVGALYASGSYFRSVLYGDREGREALPFQGWNTDILERVSREVVNAAQGGWCRVEEVMEFSRRLGAAHLGVVFCTGFRNEALLLTKVLEANGFRVSSSCCKTGSVPKEEFGIRDDEKVRPGRPEMVCNPLAQAELLNREGVQLALLLGQCVGHDSATMANLEAPAVCIVAKDRVLAHNSVAALYEMEG